jgi:hypothetical protein
MSNQESKIPAFPGVVLQLHGNLKSVVPFWSKSTPEDGMLFK